MATIRSQLGHIQIVKPGYFEKGIADPYSFLLPAKSTETETIKQFPKVENVAQRLAFSGLSSHGDTTDSITANYTTTATPASAPGAYPITPVLVDPLGRLGNYNVTLNIGTLTVNPLFTVTTNVSPVWSASRCNSHCHSRRRHPLLPPPSAVTTGSRYAAGCLAAPCR